MTVISLPLERRPAFPERCVGCGRPDTQGRWTYDRENPPFAATAHYYAVSGWLPALCVPVCRECRHFMPRDMGFWSGYTATWQVRLVNRLSRWAPDWLWRLSSPRLDSPNDLAFNVQVLRDDFVDYHFGCPETAAGFAELNGVREQVEAAVADEPR